MTYLLDYTLHSAKYYEDSIPVLTEEVRVPTRRVLSEICIRKETESMIIEW